MDLCLNQQHLAALHGLEECLARWSTMQSSTVTYIQNVQHDLKSSRVPVEAMGCLDPSLRRDIQAAYLESAEKLLRSLRGALDTFDKIVDSLRVLEGQLPKNSPDLYVSTLGGWIRDVKRMFASEVALKRQILYFLGTGLDDRAVDLQVSRWLSEPMINPDLLDFINSRTVHKQ